MTKVKSKNKTGTDANTVLGAVPYEYGAMSSKFRLYATDKLTAYATMVLHYNQSNHLVVIYEPESSKEDMWTSFTGKVSERLDEIFGGEGSFDKYLEEHISEINECYKSIERLV
jgi:hypothetical protein